MKGPVRVKLWGTTIGYLGYAPGQRTYATFEYDPSFINSGINLSPIQMKGPPHRYTFNDLSKRSFKGLPGIIADSLPDRYGSQLIDAYMAKKNLPPSEVTSLDRLLYIGNRGMGALEYHPGETLPLQRTALDIQRLSELADLLHLRQEKLCREANSREERAAAFSLIRVGSSAGGARSKALVALSPRGRLYDGTISRGESHTYWVLKFDGRENRDRDSRDPRGMPTVEYIYSIMARKAGIEMPRTRLWTCGEDRHFLIERFDRILGNHKIDKLHYASWAGLDHADRDAVHSYEQLVLLVRKMNLGQGAVTEVFRRAVFNILGRNQDDHTKNTGFLMDRSGRWRLSPAFDLTYSFNPSGQWTKNHQILLNGKNNDFELSDLLEFGGFCNLSGGQAREIISRVGEALGDFSALADEWEMPSLLKRTIVSNMRLKILA